MMQISNLDANSKKMLALGLAAATAYLWKASYSNFSLDVTAKRFGKISNRPYPVNYQPLSEVNLDRVALDYDWLRAEYMVREDGLMYTLVPWLFDQSGNTLLLIEGEFAKQSDFIYQK